MEIKLRSFEAKINSDEKIQEVRYLYSIEDSLGLLEINLTLPEESDQVEQFIIHLKDLYKGFKEYIVYHNRWKYRLDIDKNKYINEMYLNKIRMY